MKHFKTISKGQNGKSRKFLVYLTGFGYYLQETFSNKDQARKAATLTGFDCEIHFIN